jgi:hypothetical protein
MWGWAEAKTNNAHEEEEEEETAGPPKPMEEEEDEDEGADEAQQFRGLDFGGLNKHIRRAKAKIASRADDADGAMDVDTTASVNGGPPSPKNASDQENGEEEEEQETEEGEIEDDKHVSRRPKSQSSIIGTDFMA